MPSLPYKAFESLQDIDMRMFDELKSHPFSVHFSD